MSLFQKGLKTLADKLVKSAGVSVQVERNGILLGTWDAVIATNQYDDLGNDGKSILTVVSDFLFKVDYGYIPQRGDIITVANGEKYEVRPLKIESRARTIGTDVWRKDDANGSLIIVHAQKVC